MPPLLGRQAEYQSVDEAITAALNGERRLVVVIGDAASGRSALLEGAASDYALCKGDIAYLCGDALERGIFDLNSATKLRQIRDGLSKTILLGEALSSNLFPAVPP